MIDRSKVVSIHPYFKIKPGKLEEAKGMLEQFVSKTGTEDANLYYDFTFSGDVLFCREAYIGADGLLKHLENVGATLGELLKIVDLERLEVHGAAEELEKLKEPLANLKPQWFVFACGVKR